VPLPTTSDERTQLDYDNDIHTISTFKLCIVDVFYSGSSGFTFYLHRISDHYGRCFRILLRNFLGAVMLLPIKAESIEI